MNLDSINVEDLRVDGLPSGMMFCASQLPSLGWKITGERPGLKQHSYRIRARNSAGEILWDSGKVVSDISAGIRWGGSKLNSRCRVVWQVAIEDDKGNYTESSEAVFETPLFANSDWMAQWIWFDGNNPTIPSPVPYFRKEFAAGKVIQARLYAGCRGVFELHLNGKVISNDRMAPGWSDFNKQIQYLTYDVTDFLNEGNNTIGALVADGWYCSYLSGRKRNIYGEHAELLLQLEMLCADGRRMVVTTGENWRCTTGAYLHSDIYDGEAYDARLEMPGWDSNGFDDSSWRIARTGEMAVDSPALIPKCCLPVRLIEEIKPVKLMHTANDCWIWDFGQNISGGVRIGNFRSWKGILYTIRYGEMLNQDGSLYNINYRSAHTTDYYTTGGENNAEQYYETKFTFHGFRYVQIDGPQFSRVNPEDMKVTAIVCHSELERTGGFECDNPKLNRLYQNVLWGQRDNFFEIPTDCPQRDERLGWTGDAQVFCGTAASNMNVGPFFRKYLTDLREAQLENGAVPCVAPDIVHCNYGAAA
ncbi:MAG: family 78 glycoside hydrolase catalytic domain, partial [Lentisphaeria bacterium]|nr:family 78 glycoside hydrolase catalytic domain [Lentisphaeria bacterium]